MMSRFFSFSILITSVISMITFFSCEERETFQESDREWKEYLGGPERNHYSGLDQITKDNVHQLKVAWTYHTGDTGQIQCNPIIVDGVLYGMTATTQPFAIEAATGNEIWKLRPETENQFSTSRGLVYWEDGADKRILYTNEEWLIALDAKTGTPISTFGDNGRVSLKSGLGPTAKNKMVISNTPGTVYQDLIIMPLRVSEGTDAALGHIQAFNIRTGTLEWVFKTIPEPGEFGYETWPKDAYRNTEVGAGNNWAGMAVDRKLGIVYVPTGSAAYDFYGANRSGSNLFTNTLLALNAAKGELVWHFQLVHHDILDRDIPAPPNLLTVTHQGKKIDAVAQVTKQGFVFLFNRLTGEPLFPTEERPVPQSDIPGENSWPTQPFPTKPAPFSRQMITENDISEFAENRMELLEILKKSRMEGPFTPLSRGGTLVFPGLDGGADWGGAATDPEGILYVTSSEMARRIGLGPSATEDELKLLSKGQRIYALNCTPCHGAELKGSPASGYPSLIDLGNKLSKSETSTIISKGKGMMPAFTQLPDEEVNTLVAFLFQEETGIKEIMEPGLKNSGNSNLPLSYQINLYEKFLDSNGLPAITPPWGTLNAIDLNTGEFLWKVPFGEYPELTKKGIPITGAESYGGPVVTKSGLLFIAGTKDKKFRVYDKSNGSLLWESELPAAGFATPSTYEVNGKQYVVIACGGTKLDAHGGDSYVAFALPD